MSGSSSGQGEIFIEWRIVVESGLIVSLFRCQHVNTDNENIAKLIFMELNNAWSDFENDATQQKMF